MCNNACYNLDSVAYNQVYAPFVYEKLDTALMSHECMISYMTTYTKKKLNCTRITQRTVMRRVSGFWKWFSWQVLAIRGGKKNFLSTTLLREVHQLFYLFIYSKHYLGCVNYYKIYSTLETFIKFNQHLYARQPFYSGVMESQHKHSLFFLMSFWLGDHMNRILFNKEKYITYQ